MLIPIKDGEDIGNRPSVFSNALSIRNLDLPGVWIAPEIEDAIEFLFGSTEEYAEQYRAVLLRQREMLEAANSLLNHKLKFNVENPILPLDELVD